MSKHKNHSKYLNWVILTNLLFYFQVRDSDETDTYREKTVQLLDDFKISGVNGSRILFCIQVLLYSPGFIVEEEALRSVNVSSTDINVFLLGFIFPATCSLLL